MICMDKHHCFLPMLLASVIKCHVYCIALYVIFKDRPLNMAFWESIPILYRYIGHSWTNSQYVDN